MNEEQQIINNIDRRTTIVESINNVELDILINGKTSDKILKLIFLKYRDLPNIDKSIARGLNHE